MTSVKDLLRKNPTLDVNWEDDKGITALHAACKHNRADVVTLLLNHPSIEINKKTKNKETPFFVAVNHSSVECAQLLLHDPRVDIVEGRGSRTPLKEAAELDTLDILKLIIVSQRDISKENARSAVIEEARKGASEPASALLLRWRKNSQAAVVEIAEDLKIRGIIILIYI